MVDAAKRIFAPPNGDDFPLVYPSLIFDAAFSSGKDAYTQRREPREGGGPTGVGFGYFVCCMFWSCPFGGCDSYVRWDRSVFRYYWTSILFCSVLFCFVFGVSEVGSFYRWGGGLLLLKRGGSMAGWGGSFLSFPFSCSSGRAVFTVFYSTCLQLVQKDK